MKKRIGIGLLLVFGAVLLLPLRASAQVRNYTCKTTSVTSATVPVSLLAPSTETAFILHTRAGAAVSVLAFPYQTTLPGSAPSGLMEVTIGGYVYDQVSCPAANCLSGIGNGWGAVLSTGTTAVTVDACFR